MILRAVMILFWSFGAVWAQEITITLKPDIAGLLDASPEEMVKKLRSGPDAFLRNAARIIYGYGTEDGVDAAAIETYVALERAGARAQQMAAFLAADLDDDGAVSRMELIALANTRAADPRGKLRLGFDQADEDGNGSLSTVEMQDFAQESALAALTEEEELSLRGLLRFDLDGNGLTTMTEVATVVSAILADT